MCIYCIVKHIFQKSQRRGEKPADGKENPNGPVLGILVQEQLQNTSFLAKASLSGGQSGERGQLSPQATSFSRPMIRPWQADEPGPRRERTCSSAGAKLTLRRCLFPPSASAGPSPSNTPPEGEVRQEEPWGEWSWWPPAGERTRCVWSRQRCPAVWRTCGTRGSGTVWSPTCHRRCATSPRRRRSGWGQGRQARRPLRVLGAALPCPGDLVLRVDKASVDAGVHTCEHVRARMNTGARAPGGEGGRSGCSR